MQSPRALPLGVLVCLLPLGLLGLTAPVAYGQVRGPAGLIGIGFTRGGAPGFGPGVGVSPGFGFGPGVGVGFGPGLLWPGFFVNAYQGFYNNGFSLYGPPVPTHGPIPGFFGGADQRFYGLGAYYAFPPPNYDPRQAVLFANVLRGPSGEVSLQFVPAGPDHPMFGGRCVIVQRVASAPSDRDRDRDRDREPACADIEVRLPQADAKVSVDGQLTPTHGSVRRLQSPPLASGQEYEYRIGAIWHEEGRSVSRERVVRLRAGSRALVDFTQPLDE